MITFKTMSFSLAFSLFMLSLSLSLSLLAHYTLLYAAFMYREKNGKEQLGWPLCWFGLLLEAILIDRYIERGRGRG
jgi:hypothetical protein